MRRNEFLEDLQIDPNQLDVMAGLQGELFFKWAEKSTSAKARVDETKFAFEVLSAQLAAKARLNPEVFGILKVTDASVDAAVKNSAQYREAYQEWLEARRESGLLEKAVEAMEQRKRMIELLVTLHGQQYFAGPSVPRSLADAWKAVQRDRESAVIARTKLRRRGEVS